jgi:hypothetical protein
MIFFREKRFIAPEEKDPTSTFRTNLAALVRHQDRVRKPSSQAPAILVEIHPFGQQSIMEA